MSRHHVCIDRPAAAAARAALAAAALALLAAGPVSASDARLAQGRKVYDYYCYQCHGYNGDAATLASTYLDPQPRNFAQTPPATLPRARMLAAVRHGRPGTGMVGFASVLTPDQTEAVVDYIRARFMRGTAPARRYHVAENGWPDHARYAPAFPFATGAIALDTPWEKLSAAQQAGKRLFLSACISCHDRARVDNPGPVWEPYAVSWPRAGSVLGYGQPPDATSGATPFARHDQPPPQAGLAPAAARGRTLFLANCAFCHAADGTGRNWIGSFLEPRPRDLTQAPIRRLPAAVLQQVIEHGLPGTSMPAWGAVLDRRQIGDLVTYLRRDEPRAPPAAPSASPGMTAPAAAPLWRAAPAR